MMPRPEGTLFAARGYFFVVLWFTLWVGYIGFFRPEEILRALPWPVPGLHARFIGALYLSATVFLGLAMFASGWARMRVVVAIALAWTGWLLVVTIVHWEAFDPGRVQVRFWLVAYLAFPVVAAWLAWRGRSSAPDETPDAHDAIGPAWVVACLRAAGVLLLVTAVLMFVTPGLVARLWPWKLSDFLAQVYSGPVLGYAVGCLAMARLRRWSAAQIPAVGMAVFAALAIVASLRHLELFARGGVATIVWFVLLGAIAGASAAVALLALRAGRHHRGTP